LRVPLFPIQNLAVRDAAVQQLAVLSLFADIAGTGDAKVPEAARRSLHFPTLQPLPQMSVEAQDRDPNTVSQVRGA
jgi:hypothetical protein